MDGLILELDAVERYSLDLRRRVTEADQLEACVRRHIEERASHAALFLFQALSELDEVEGHSQSGNASESR